MVSLQCGIFSIVFVRCAEFHLDGTACNYWRQLSKFIVKVSKCPFQCEKYMFLGIYPFEKKWRSVLKADNDKKCIHLRIECILTTLALVHSGMHCSGGMAVLEVPD